MQNGFRKKAEPTRKEMMRQATTEVKNLQAAVRINQMMMQQIVNTTQNMQHDLGKALAMISELQYKFLAVQKVANLDEKTLQDTSNALRLEDFNEASDKEDIKENYKTVDTVAEDSIVIITTEAEDPDKSIFRSKIGLKEANVPDLTKGLLGREVGAQVVLKLGETQHKVTLLGIRQPPPPEVVPQPTEELAQPEPAPVAVQLDAAPEATQAAQ